MAIGAITGVYGIKGWVKIRSWTRPTENIFNYQPWLLTRDKVGLAGEASDVDNPAEDMQAVELQHKRSQNDRITVKLAGADNREQAQLLVGAQIVVARSQMPATEDSEYYWSDLVGLTVRNLHAVTLGQVSGMLETGANDVLIVQGERERLLPFVAGQVIHKVDLDRQTILVDWDEDF